VRLTQIVHKFDNISCVTCNSLYLSRAPNFCNASGKKSEKISVSVCSVTRRLVKPYKIQAHLLRFIYTFSLEMTKLINI